MICHLVFDPVVMIVRTIVAVVTTILRTVCEWVSTVVTTIKEVVEKVCSWLPWPLSTICNWVTKLIEVVETVWEWVCREIVERIITLIEVITEYVIYVLRWVCFFIDWILVRWWAIILCRLGIRPQQVMPVCVKVLTDSAGTPGVALDRVTAMMRDAAAILANCNICLKVVSVEQIAQERFLDSTTCEFSGIFNRFFTWFGNRACGGAVTVYFVRDIKGASGCAYPGADWVTVDAGGDGGTVVQEIGHLTGMWSHTSDPNNVMTDQSGGTGDQITSGQCCMFRTSQFTRLALPGECKESGRDATGAAAAGLEFGGRPHHH